MWVVTVHECSGSTAEAIDVYASFGGFASEGDARQFAEMLHQTLTLATRKQGGYAEWFTQHFEVPDIKNLNLPRATEDQLKEFRAEHGQVPPGTALDLRRLAEMIIDDEVEELPPAPEQEEIDDALASIFGGCACDIDYLDPACRNPSHVNPPEGFGEGSDHV